MTPKEKAEDLLINYLNNINTVPPRCGLVTSEAKQCALIAVDEIIDIISSFAYSDTAYDDFETGKYTFWSGKSPQTYWQQVKDEINKL